MNEASVVAIELPPGREATLEYLNQTIPRLSPLMDQLILYMSTYDNDPRELFEIPEAREAWKAAFVVLNEHRLLDKLEQESKAAMSFAFGYELDYCFWSVIKTQGVFMAKPGEEPEDQEDAASHSTSW